MTVKTEFTNFTTPMKGTRATSASVPRLARLAFGLRWFCCAWLVGALLSSASAALQFDVFVGYDNTIKEASWFPVACEVSNDGPAFVGVFEFTSDSGGRGQSRQCVTELPTGTRKRFVIPAFASAGRFSRWSARLLDERGKLRAERTAIQTKDRPWDSLLMGALPRTFSGMPDLPKNSSRQEDLQPVIARMQVEYFPDNPIQLEGLDLVYLNSEKAPDLKVNQASALLHWVNGGGHLIVAVEQPADVSSTPWLRQLLPCELTSVATVKMQGEIQTWLRGSRDPEGEKGAVSAAGETPAPQLQMDDRMLKRYGVKSPAATRPPRGKAAAPVEDAFAKLPADATFDEAELPVATGTLKDGRVLLSVGGNPLIIEARRGRGLVTVLASSPEREPFRSWKNRPWFFAKAANMPSAVFTTTDFNRYGGWSIDAVIGAMIDSTQVRKLPVTWLLLLLVVYLVVIGPLDQYWLKKINRQMLTWLTFPAYVALFSGLIYFIGYKLRAGETEWNELHFVDVLPRGGQADLRGRTYASVYSPVNAKYELISDQPYATVRGEFQGPWSGGPEISRASVEQRGKGFRAEVYVPVWTSQLFISDWLQPADLPLAARVTQQGGKFEVTVENHLNYKLNDVRVAVNGKLHNLGALAANQTKSFTLDPDREATSLKSFVDQYRGQFFTAVQSRRRALGDDRGGRLEKNSTNVIAASFVSRGDEFRPNNQYFVAPSGLDVTELVDRGDAVVFAWTEEHALTTPINRFTPRRTHRDTMLRLAVPVIAGK